MASGSVTRRGEAWRARYRHPELGTEHQRTFDRKVEAQRWLRQELERVESGTWVDGSAGSITFEQFFESWAARQVWTTNTQVAMSLAVRVDVVPIDAAARDPHHPRRDVGEVDDDRRPPSGRRWRRARSRPGSSTSARCSGPRSGTGVIARRPDRRRPAAPAAQARRGAADPDPDEVGPVPGRRRRAVPGVRRRLRPGRAAARRGGRAAVRRRRLPAPAAARAAAGAASRRRGGRDPAAEVRLGAVGADARGAGGDPARARGARASSRTGCSPAARTTRRTRTPSATGGAPPCSGAGLSGIRLHDLRHFYASGLIADGCDVVTVQRALGHAKASTTLDTYAKLWPSGEDRTRRAASSLARQVLADSARNAGEMWAERPINGL